MGGGEAAATIVAGTGLLAAIGKGWRWLSGVRRGRIGELERKVDELAGHRAEDSKRTECILAIAIIAINEIRAINPGSRALIDVRGIIGDAYPDLLRRFFPIAPVDPNDALSLLVEQANEALREIRDGKR